MRSYLTVRAKINEIKILIATKSYRGKTIFAVEGPSDAKTFQSLLLEDTTAVRELGGKPHVIATVAQFYNNPRVIGLCDADFDHIQPHDEYPSNIILTDFHDLEMMMLAAEPAEPSDKVINEISTPNALPELRHNLMPATMEAALKLGKMRLLNEMEQVKLNFSKLRFQEFVIVESDPFRLDVDIDKVLDLLFTPSDKNTQSQERFSDMLDAFDITGYPTFQVCNGHDVTEILSIVSQSRALSQNAMNKQKIEQLLRMAYSRAFFARTSMYASIQAFESTTGELLA